MRKQHIPCIGHRLFLDEDFNHRDPLQREKHAHTCTRTHAIFAIRHSKENSCVNDFVSTKIRVCTCLQHLPSPGSSGIQPNADRCSTGTANTSCPRRREMERRRSHLPPSSPYGRHTRTFVTTSCQPKVCRARRKSTTQATRVPYHSHVAGSIAGLTCAQQSRPPWPLGLVHLLASQFPEGRQVYFQQVCPAA